MKEMIKKNWLLVLVVAQPILDIIAYFQYDNLFGSMAGYIRLLIMFAIPLAVLLLKRKLSFGILMGVIGLYCLLHVASCYINGYANLFSDVSYLLRVIQMPVLAISFCFLFDKETYKEQIVKGFVINYIVIVISIILAFITKTGDYTYRDYEIGYTGWFANANSQSIILISMAPFVIYYAIKKKNKVGIILAMFAVPIVLLSNGTTAGYLAIFVIFGGFFAFYVVDFFMKKRQRKRIQPAMIIGALVIMIFSGVVYPLTPKYAMDTYDNGKREEENEKLNQKKNKIGQGHEITLEEILADPEAKQMLIDTYKDELNPDLVEKFGVERVLEEYGWWPDSYTLADVRLQKRINAKLIWEDSNMLTKFFGIEFTEMEDYDLENDYPAIYYYYGYIGFGLYVIFLAYFLILIIKTLIKNFKGSFFFFNFILAVTYVLQLGLAQFSGAILRRPNASIYMSLIIALIFYQCRKIENQSKDKVKKVGKNGQNTVLSEKNY